MGRSDDTGTRPSARLPPLLMLSAFEAVGRTGSMRRAAADMHVSHTLVSRQVRQLEAWLAVKLVDSGPRGVTLTAEGQRLFAGLSTGFAQIAETIGALRPAGQRRSLRVWCMPGLAARWLAPRLSAINALVPQAELLMRAIDRLPDFRHHEADVMIAYGETAELPAGALLLQRPRMFPVAAPDWLRRHGPVTTLATLAQSPLIHEESQRQWAGWFAALGVALARDLSGPRLWDANLGLDAAIAGQGIALASVLTAGDEIAAGRLVELLSTEVRLGGYYLIVAPDHQQDPAVRRLAAWLRESMAG